MQLYGVLWEPLIRQIHIFFTIEVYFFIIHCQYIIVTLILMVHKRTEESAGRLNQALTLR